MIYCSTKSKLETFAPQVAGKSHSEEREGNLENGWFELASFDCAQQIQTLLQAATSHSALLWPQKIRT